MKNLALTISAVVSGLSLAGSAIAAGKIGSAAPAPATVEAVATFVNRYADAGLLTAATAAAGRATQVVLYPTADRQVVFVTFHTGDTDGQGDHIALVKTHGDRVTGFTDFTGIQPRTVLAARSDAQSQARALLVAAVPASSGTAPVATSRETPVSAQAQAAALLQPASATPTSGEPRRLVARSTVTVHGDSQAMARAVLTQSAGE